jgi:hypothetical protein
MGPANDAANLEMGPGNDAGASTDSVRQPGPKEVSTDCVSQAGPKAVYVTLMRPTCTKTRQEGDEMSWKSVFVL